MERLYKAKYLFILSIFIVILVSTVKGYAMGIMGEWELLKIKPELELYAVDSKSDTIVSSHNDLYKTDNAVPVESRINDNKSDNTWSILKYRNVSISLSHLVVQQLQIDARKITAGGSDKLDSIKSIPSVFLTSSYRDTFESIGRMFEPRVDLRIEF